MTWRAAFSFVVASVCVVFVVHAQERIASGPLKGFTAAHPEHIIVELEHPIEVRAISGIVFFHDRNDPLPGALIEIRDETGKIRSAKANKHGNFTMKGVPPGAYDFKVTKDGWQSVAGKIAVTKKAPQKNKIEIQMPLGV